MKTVKITMLMDIEDNFLDDIKKITHHADYLIDMNENPEILSVYDVTVEEKNN